jgi:hypothetical protein
VLVISAACAVLAILLLLEGRAAASEDDDRVSAAALVEATVQDVTGLTGVLDTGILDTGILDSGDGASGVDGPTEAAPPTAPPTAHPLSGDPLSGIPTAVLAPVLDLLPDDAGSPPARLDGNLGDTVDAALGRAIDGVTAVLAPAPDGVLDDVITEVRDAVPYTPASPATGLVDPNAVATAVASVTAADPTDGTGIAPTRTADAADPVVARPGRVPAGDPAARPAAAAVRIAAGASAHDSAPAANPNPNPMSPTAPLAPAPLAPASAPVPAPGGDATRAGTQPVIHAALPTASAPGGTAWWLVAAGVFGWRSALLRSRLERPG